jgi:hypothetical protein
MSRTMQELETLAMFEADLDMAIAEKDWKECRIIIEDVKEGYPHEARMMQDSLRRAVEGEENPFLAKTAHLSDKEVVEGMGSAPHKVVGGQMDAIWKGVKKSI